MLTSPNLSDQPASLRPSELARTDVLRAFRIPQLGSAAEFERFVHLAKDIFLVPIAYISLLDDQRQLLSASTGGLPAELPIDEALCSAMIEAAAPLVIPDTRLDPRTASNPLVQASPSIRFYAGVPLVLEGIAVGGLCIASPYPRTLCNQELSILESLGALVVNQLWLHRRTMEARENEERFRLAAQATNDTVYDWNIPADEVLGGHGGAADLPQAELYPVATFTGWKEMLHPEDRQRTVASLEEALAGDAATWICEYRYRRPDGTYATVLDRCTIVRDEDGRATRAIGAVQDISKRKQAEQALVHAAYHDPLTGLANRALLRQRKSEAIAQAERDGGKVGLLYIDLDGFKDVNDTSGHDVGDALLKVVSGRLATSIPPTATLARLGGDEFAVLLTRITDEGELQACGEKIIQAVDAPIEIGDGRYHCTASVGAALHTQGTYKKGDLLKNADLALYEAKRLGRNRLAMFDPALRSAVEHRVHVLNRTRDALARDAIMPFYQPKLNLRTGRIEGFEALLRWVSPEGRLRLPGEISQAFQVRDISLSLGKRMLDKVLDDIASWRGQAIPFGSVALNLSAHQFDQPELADSILAALEARDLPPSVVELELTETVVLDSDSNVVANSLRRLNAKGLSIALDDFGTGYASLMHLHRLPVNSLKIDRSFVQGIPTCPDDAAIVRAIIDLSHSLGIRVVAEGVETPEQLSYLTRKGCDQVQGYLVAKPMPASRVRGFLRKWSTLSGDGQQEKIAV